MKNLVVLLIGILLLLTVSACGTRWKQSQINETNSSLQKTEKQVQGQPPTYPKSEQKLSEDAPSQQLIEVDQALDDLDQLLKDSDIVDDTNQDQ